MNTTPLKYVHAEGSTDYVESLILDKCDPTLGRAIEDKLLQLGLENPRKGEYNPMEAVKALERGIDEGLSRLGLDLSDPSMTDTSKRYAKMVVGELTKGLNYDFFPKCTATPAEGMNDMVLVSNIEVMSLCEHHLQTIDGYAWIAYIPETKLLGLSKFARVVEFFSRRPQVQERLTNQIYHALSHILGTENVAVIVRAKHYCMKARGSQQHNSDTTTDKVGGKFMSSPALRAEFFAAARM